MICSVGPKERIYGQGVEGDDVGVGVWCMATEGRGAVLRQKSSGGLGGKVELKFHGRNGQKGTVGTSAAQSPAPGDLRQEYTHSKGCERANSQVSTEHCRRISLSRTGQPCARYQKAPGDDNPSHALFRFQEHALMRPLNHLTAASVSAERHSHGTRHGSLTQLRLPPKLVDSFLSKQ